MTEAEEKTNARAAIRQAREEEAARALKESKKRLRPVAEAVGEAEGEEEGEEEKAERPQPPKKALVAKQKPAPAKSAPAPVVPAKQAKVWHRVSSRCLRRQAPSKPATGQPADDAAGAPTGSKKRPRPAAEPAQEPEEGDKEEEEETEQPRAPKKPPTTKQKPVPAKPAPAPTVPRKHAKVWHPARLCRSQQQGSKPAPEPPADDTEVEAPAKKKAPKKSAAKNVPEKKEDDFMDDGDNNLCPADVSASTKAPYAVPHAVCTAPLAIKREGKLWSVLQGLEPFSGQAEYDGKVTNLLDFVCALQLFFDVSSKTAEYRIVLRGQRVAPLSETGLADYLAAPYPLFLPSNPWFRTLRHACGVRKSKKESPDSPPFFCALLVADVKPLEWAEGRLLRANFMDIVDKDDLWIASRSYKTDKGKTSTRTSKMLWRLICVNCVGYIPLPTTGTSPFTPGAYAYVPESSVVSIDNPLRLMYLLPTGEGNGGAPRVYVHVMPKERGHTVSYNGIDMSDYITSGDVPMCGRALEPERSSTWEQQAILKESDERAAKYLLPQLSGGQSIDLQALQQPAPVDSDSDEDAPPAAKPSAVKHAVAAAKAAPKKNATGAGARQAQANEQPEAMDEEEEKGDEENEKEENPNEKVEQEDEENEAEEEEEKEAEAEAGEGEAEEGDAQDTAQAEEDAANADQPPPTNTEPVESPEDSTAKAVEAATTAEQASKPPSSANAAVCPIAGVPDPVTRTSASQTPHEPTQEVAKEPPPSPSKPVGPAVVGRAAESSLRPPTPLDYEDHVPVAHQ